VTNTELAAQAAAEKVNILLVDDRPDKRLALGAMLEEMGENLVMASSGEEALRHLLRADFAVILLDVNMPEMDGFQTAALIRERERSATTPIIFLTAVNDAEAHVFRGYSLGAVDYILMPVHPEVLRAKVSVFVDLFRKTEQVRRQAEWMRAAEEREHAARIAEAEDRIDRETRRNRFFTLADDMLGIAGLDGTLRQLNPAWERSLGFGEAELLSRPFIDFVHPEDRDSTLLEWGKLSLGASSTRFDNRHRHKDGSYRWLAWNASAFPQEELVYVFVRDITFRKLAEEQRLQLAREQEARAAAQRESELKDQFLATLSHELRAPLTPILGWVSLLRAGRLDPEMSARAVEVIDRNVRLEAQLVEELLEMSRIASGTLQVDLLSMDLVPVVEAGLQAMRPAASAKQLEVQALLPSEPVPVRGDPQRLQQVVANLLGNAVKFTPEGGRVDVTLENSSGVAKLRVSDTGVGIAPDFLPRVFEPFRQADGSTSRAHGGLGLGLTIVRHLVEAHGGTIEAASAGPGSGACFSVALPTETLERAAASPSDGTISLGGRAPARLSGLTLLLVDDNPEVLEVLRVFLEREGALVHTAGSVAEAFAALERTAPHVVLSDIGLPGEDGYALSERLRTRAAEAGRPIPAIALTAYATEEDTRRARAAGFQAHLPKPVDLPRVLETVASLAGRGV
jgi:PAS domain S-box-containing protein